MASFEDREFLQTKIQEGNVLLKRCLQLQNIEGLLKLKKKITAELHFLSKLQFKERIQHEHLKCSNLIHLKGIVDVATSLSGVTAVLHPFHSKDQNERILVDVVADNGRTWIKVIARNPHALHQISLGQGQFGEKSVLQHAENYLKFASCNLIFYKIPSIKFVFCNELPEVLAKKLEKIGVIVVGQSLEFKLKDSHSTEFNKECESNTFSSNSVFESINVELTNQSSENALKLNLDITAMIAFVSSLTNGNCFFHFKEKILNQQAHEERKKAVKPILESLFKGRDLICCNTALEGFKNIIFTLGGPTERERAKQLLDRVMIVPDHLSERTSNLELTSQIKPRSKIIFGSGDHFQAITVTANTGFIRSAESQGIKLAVFVHQSRALTENKEKFAQALDPNEK